MFPTAHKRTGERVFVQQRYERLQERKRAKRLSEFQKTLEVNDEETRGNDGGEQNDEETRGNDGGEQNDEETHGNDVHEIEITSAHNDEEQTAPIITEEVIDAAATLVQLSGNQQFVKEQETQTDTFVEELMTKVHDLIEKNKSLNHQLQDCAFSFKIMEANDNLTAFYTGLPSWVVFLHVYMYTVPYVPQGRSLSSMDELFLTLVKLRLNLMHNDLACRFRISKSTVSRIFHRWLDVLHDKLQFLLVWPSQDTIRENMPLIFKQLYPRCRCIIDCSEIFIETPSCFRARAQTYSNYKKHNTVKFLIAITPCGTISFLSDCWGGRVSDKVLTQESGILDLLEPGDTVLADRGFTIDEDVILHGAKLEIPAFTRGKKQLSQEEVERSKQLSQVRIHVERCIGLLKNKYTILKGTLPICLVKNDGDTHGSTIDKMLIVCSALTNLPASIVPE